MILNYAIMKIKINNSDLKILKKYSEESYKFYNKQGRPNTTIINNIFVGKLGEFAFKKIFKDDLNELDLSIKEGHDGGYDFMYKDKYKIDVKTLKKDSFSRVFLNSDFMMADYYALMKITDKTKDGIEVKFDGFMPTEFAKKNLKYKQSREKQVSFVDAYLFQKITL
jgi:hypothetical protein